MRIACFADIHANLPALEAVIADARERGASHVLGLGDVVGYGPQPVEALARFREVASAAVLGNHDAAVCGLLDPALFNAFARETAERAALALSDEAKGWLRALPYVIESDGLACAHGGFADPARFHYLETKADAALNFAAMPGFQVLVVGHTHIPCVFAREEATGTIRKLPPEDFVLRAGWRYILNPGAVGFPRGNTLTADYLLFDTVTRHVLFRAVPYDLAPYRLALVRNGYNPMNYWFLSPSARRSQREQAFLKPTRAAEVPVGEGAPFRPRQAHRLPHAFWWAMGALAALILALAAVLIWLGYTVREADLAEQTAPAGPEQNLFPPLTQWVFPEGAGVCAEVLERGAGVRLSPQGAAPAELLSPLCRVPPGIRQLRLSFQVTSPLKTLRYTAQVRFLCAEGRARDEKVHVYKKPGVRAYSVDVPADAAGVRVAFSFSGSAPATLLRPVLAPFTHK